MKPTEKIATTRTPDGSEMVLYRHDADFSIKVAGHELMNSRQHESELELARLGCSHLKVRNAPTILIGGLGLGYTLRATLDMLGPRASVVVAEQSADVVDWNRRHFSQLNGDPLLDKRVHLKTGDVLKIIADADRRFDAILLDIDNGPDAMTDSGNRRLYDRAGIEACRRALCERGCLAVWSADASKPFEQQLMRCGFHVRRFRVPAYKGSKSQGRIIWVASENKGVLPVGGGEPRKAKPPKRLSTTKKRKEHQRRPRY
jgi:spermidine synthase